MFKTLFFENSDLNRKPVNATRFFLLDDLDCPNISGKCGQQDGDVGDGEGNGDAVHDGGRLAHQAQARVPSRQLNLPSKLHTQKAMGMLVIVRQRSLSTWIN